MSNRNANIWQMTLNVSLQFGETKRQNNCFILKFLMIKKNGTHSHNFKDIVELVDDCGTKEISLHLLTAPKMQNTFHYCMSQSTLKLCLII